MSDSPFIFDVEQGSEIWKELRCGNTTASRSRDALDTLVSGKAYTAERAKYRAELICERLTGQPYPRYVTAEMQWGTDLEPFARAAYELHAGVLVETVGFVIHSTIARFGASPDGLVNDDGLIQIKCPTTKTHLDTIFEGVIPVEHTFQMLAEMSCTGRKWCDFVSFDPRLPEHLQLFVRRYERDEKLIRALEAGIVDFNDEIERFLKALPQGPAPVVKMLDQANDDEAEF